MVYKRLMNSIETSYMHSHALTFICSCMIGKWILNDAKPLLSQSQFFRIIPPDSGQWSHSRFIQIFPTKHIVMAGHQCTTPIGPQQRPIDHQHIPPLQMNTAGIPVRQLDAE